MHLDKLRATGRTTRMIKDALGLAGNGRAVYIIAATERHKHDIESLGGEALSLLGIKVETPDSLGNFDWNTMRLTGAHPNCVVLVDHHAIEVRFATMLDMLHRYDD